MKIKVLLFAQLRDFYGKGDLSLELPDGARASQVLDSLRLLRDAALPPLTFAVNCEQAEPATFLHHGDEVALLPPVSGG